MSKLRFTIEVHPADADETGYWVSVPALPGCFSQGETYEEALTNAEEAIIGYVEALIKEGRPIPLEKRPASKVAIAVEIPVSSPQ